MGISESGNRNDVLEEGYLSGVKTITDSATALRVGGSDLTNRQEILLYNDGSNTCYIGPSGVTATGSTKGIPLDPEDTLDLPIGSTVYAICGTGLTTSVIVQEFK